MHPKIDVLLEEAEQRYLQTNELNLLNQYVRTVPTRLEVYRFLQERDIEVMQWVADQMQASLGADAQPMLERSLRNALLTLRYCALAMLLDDENLVADKLGTWWQESNMDAEARSVDVNLFRFLNQRLSELLSQPQMALLTPHLTAVERLLLQQDPATPVAV